jgi:hypothetical protein
LPSSDASWPRPQSSRAYGYARADLGFPEFPPGEETLLGDFRTWLERKLDRKSNLDWSQLVEVADPSDRSVQTFVKLFDEFLKEAAGIRDGLPGPPKSSS